MGFIAINYIQISGSTEVSVQITGITSGTTALEDNDFRLATERAIKNYVDDQISVSGGTVISNFGVNRVLTSDGTSKGIDANSDLVYSGSTKSLYVGQNLYVDQGVTNNLRLGQSDSYIQEVTGLMNFYTNGVSSLTLNDEYVIFNNKLNDTIIRFNGDITTGIGRESNGVIAFYSNSGTTLTLSETLNTSHNIIRYISGLTFSNDEDIVNKLYVDGLITSSGGTEITNPGNDYLLTSDGTTKGIDANSGMTFDGNDLFLPNMGTGTQVNAVFYNTTTGELSYGSATTGSVTEVTSSTTSQLTVANGTTTPALTIVTGAVVDSGTALATGDQIYDFVTAFGYTTNVGTVTSISAGDGMDFTSVTVSGDITLGTPSEITSGSTNIVTSISHTHAYNANTFVTGGGGILVAGNQFILDDSYITEQTLPSLYSYTGITANQDIGILPSGQTLGMVYIINNGTADASVDLGTTSTGNDITPYRTIDVASGETVSVTVNMRLSDSQSKTMYVNSDDWTNIDIDLEWAKITYQNASSTLSPGDLPIASEVSLGAIKVGTTLTIDVEGVLDIDSGLDDLNDVTITTPTNTETLVYSGGEWINSGLTLSTDLDSLTDVTITAPNDGESLIYSGGTWVNTGTTGGGSGGFLGTVTKDSVEPADLQENQWVQPEPESDGTFEYTFDNFLGSGATSININLSLENVKLRYDNGGYWVKESFNKPLSSGKTWIGDDDNEVEEVKVVEEWVSSESQIQWIGQKFAYDTHTLFKTDFDVTTTIQNYIFIEDIDLKTVGYTNMMTIPAGKSAVFNRFKLIILSDASPTSFQISIGNNYGTCNNLSPLVTIDDVLTNETYDLEVSQNGVSVSSGSVVYFRVVSASTNVNPLTAHLLVEGFLY